MCCCPTKTACQWLSAPAAETKQSLKLAPHRAHCNAPIVKLLHHGLLKPHHPAQAVAVAGEAAMLGKGTSQD